MHSRFVPSWEAPVSYRPNSHNEKLATPVTDAEMLSSTKCECYWFLSIGIVKENILSRLVSVYIKVNIIQLSAYPVFDL